MLRGYRTPALAASLAAAIAGCTKPAPPAAAAKLPEVIVASPIIQPVVDHEDFVGHTDAVNSVDIRSQVTGYLERYNFDLDGKDVKEGDLLFEIDPRTFQATLLQTQGSEAQAQAHLDRVTKDYKRIKGFDGSKAMSQEDIDRYTGDKLEAEAALKVATANRILAETNLNYTRITAKFSGRLSNRKVDPGNMVKANDTVLNTLVALDPIYATFDMDERTVLQIRRLIDRGEVESTQSLASHNKPQITVKIGLADEEGFSLEGKVDFRDNQFDRSTGTFRVRAVLPNPKKLKDPNDPYARPDYLLSPGLFIRVRVPIGEPHKAILIPDEALGSDQGQQYVYVVSAQNLVEKRKVKTGMQVEVKRGRLADDYRVLETGMKALVGGVVLPAPSDQYRVVEEGLAATERVVTKGLQRVRPGAAVTAMTEAEARARTAAAKAKDDKAKSDKPSSK